MEIILTLSVLIALVALGVTISLGNERQRQAIQMQCPQDAVQKAPHRLVNGNPHLRDDRYREYGRKHAAGFEEPFDAFALPVHHQSEKERNGQTYEGG